MEDGFSFWWCCTSVPIQRLPSPRGFAVCRARYWFSVFISHANVAGIYELLSFWNAHSAQIDSFTKFEDKFKCDADFLFKYGVEHLKCQQLLAANSEQSTRTRYIFDGARKSKTIQFQPLNARASIKIDWFEVVRHFTGALINVSCVGVNVWVTCLLRNVMSFV